MPINIFVAFDETVPTQEEAKSIAWLCDDGWELPAQLFEFERWLENDGKYLPKGNYVADIGFSPRSGASGGGGTLSVSAMRTLVLVGIEIWFSEYTN